MISRHIMVQLRQDWNSDEPQPSPKLGVRYRHQSFATSRCTSSHAVASELKTDHRCNDRRGQIMTTSRFNNALIVGAGSGLSASLARALANDGIKVALAARTTGDLDPLVKDIGGRAVTCDPRKPR